MEQQGNQSVLPVIELPKAGGVISNSGNKFSVNAASGSSSISIPITVSEARNDFQPILSLHYDSGLGNSAFGLGWKLSIPSISRKTTRGLPQYMDNQDSDTFLLSGTEDLVPFLEKDSMNWNRKIDTDSDPDYNIHYYRPRTEKDFSKIEKWISKTNQYDVHWKVTDSENVTRIFGKSKESRIINPSQKHHIFEWLLEESRDNLGNIIQYTYIKENTDNINTSKASEGLRLENNESFEQRYIKTISYCNQMPNVASDWHFQVVFDYGDHDENRPTPSDYLSADCTWNTRLDPFSTYTAGFELRTYRLCERILVFHQFNVLNEGQPTLVRSTNLVHHHDPVASTLIRSYSVGYCKSEEGYSSKKTPETHYKYSDPIVGKTVQRLSEESLEHLSGGINDHYQFVDLEGEGLSGILTAQNEGWFYKSNHGNGQFGNAQLVHEYPSTVRRAAPQIQDMDGDGNKELVVINDQLRGFFDYRDKKWEGFTAFEQMPNVDFENPNLRYIDLSGDGFVDILITEEDSLHWFPSLEKKGFEACRQVQKKIDDEKGPTIVFEDGTESIYLADMSGDGLTDLVRVRNNEICYWPNLGYGQFGAKITMDNVPYFDFPDHFNQANIRLADINGRGTTDILYFNSDGARFWINQSGNAWSVAQVLDQFPMVNQVVNVQLADILGMGTPCLTWSSTLPQDNGRQLQFIDLMEATEAKPHGKPYLLVEVNNNQGKIDQFEYTPSTKFYLADKLAGNPWVTKLHFPVDVVEKKVTIDEISNSRLVVSYQYHHGYFDPVEREFRGFGMVEKLDSESFEKLALSNASGELKDHNLPAILTKTWFHTGAVDSNGSISKHYATEYFKESDVPLAPHPGENYLMEDSRLEFIEKSSFQSNREAFRVLHGQELREEIYALDGTEKQNIPYAVVETNYTVKEIQPVANQKHGVFMFLMNEQIEFNYERDCCDPRVKHSITIESDAYGTPLKAVEIAYPRRLNGRIELPEEQCFQKIKLSENVVVNIDANPDFYHLGIRTDEKSLEITGIFPDETYYTADEIRAKIAQIIEETPFYPELNDGVSRKRLLTWEKKFFWNSELSEVLPNGEVTWPLLLRNTESAILTSELITACFGDKLIPEQVSELGGYVLKDNYWWDPGTILHYTYHDDPNADARNRNNAFLHPVEAQIPFEQSEEVQSRIRIFYDDYHLVPTSSDDPLGQTTSSEIDYRTLHGVKLTDINENVSEVMMDELGMVIASTRYGSEERLDGTVFTNGDLPISLYNRMDSVSREKLLDKPYDYLQGASSFFFYDLTAWQDRKEPPHHISLKRETYARELENPEDTLLQVAISYSDGFGRELQQKVKVGEGKAFRTNEAGGLLLDPETQVAISEPVASRWLSSGRIVFNNKEKPIKKYEPFYIDSPVYLKQDDLPRIGVTPTIHYDSLARVIQTETPEGFISKVEIGAWESKSYDQNDTVKDSEYYTGVMDGSIVVSIEKKQALIKAGKHFNTPTETHFDVLGRPFLSVNLDEDGVTYTTKSSFSITGKKRTIIDPRQFDLNNEPARLGNPIYTYQHMYDMAGNALRNIGIDAGENSGFTNVMGNPVFAWTARGFKTTIEYDFMQRPLSISVENGDLEQKTVVEKMEYAQVDTPASKNVRSRLISHYDQTGKTFTKRVAFDMEPLETEQQFLSIFDSENPGALNTRLGEIVDWSVLSDDDLEDEIFKASRNTNAIGRVITSTSPDGTVHRPTFNSSGQLEKLEIQHRGVGEFVEFVSDIQYNEKGQRSAITYGNGTRSFYTYDPLNFRLTRLKTTRTEGENLLQDIHYTYDPIGNITQIKDDAQQTIFFNNHKVDAINDYTYDAFYQLKIATGREHIGQTAFTSPDDQVNPAKIIPHKGNGQQMRSYTREFDYDKAGNMLQSNHKPVGAPNFKRQFRYSEDSNHLIKSGIGAEETWKNYVYDAAGNMLELQHLNAIHWDYKNQVQQIDRTGLTAYYQYTAVGQRGRKIIKKGVNKVEVRYYLGDFEIFRKYTLGSEEPNLERETLHVLDDSRRIALIDYKSIDTSPGTMDAPIVKAIRYQLGNHMESASIELDENENLISYEEYYPYGSSSYRAVDKTREVPVKRYRYTAMERDEESGLNYHSARYYAPWLCRWIKPDPAEDRDGLNVYRYVSGNPITFVDISGNDGTVVQVIHSSHSTNFVTLVNTDTSAISTNMFSRRYLFSGPGIYAAESAAGIQGATGQSVVQFSIRADQIAVADEWTTKVYNDPKYRSAMSGGSASGDGHSRAIQERFRTSTQGGPPAMDPSHTEIMDRHIKSQSRPGGVYHNKSVIRISTKEGYVYVIRDAQKAIVQGSGRVIGTMKDGVFRAITPPAAGAGAAPRATTPRTTAKPKATVPRTPSGGTVLRAGGGALLLLEGFFMWRDEKTKDIIQETYIFEDQYGKYTVWKIDNGIFSSDDYGKTYVEGPNKGKAVSITEDQYDAYKAEVRKKWGYIDWKGDFVPGTERKTLPIIYVPPDPCAPDQWGRPTCA